MKNIFFGRVVLFFKHFPVSLATILLIATILRIPTFFEPYWYGDEGIYLVIGTALNRGALMYTEIVDHKTPLIYYLARVDSQLEFRVLLYFWMIAATTAFYFLARHFHKSKKVVLFATALFMFFTTVPWLEGNIANGELFVMGFVLVGMALLTKTTYFSTLKNEKQFDRYTFTKKEGIGLFGTGFLLGLAILTKVPALFDALAVMSTFYFIALNRSFQKGLNIKNIFKSIVTAIKPAVALGIGIVTPILISIVYYYALGSGQDYLDFGLLYNFKYAGSWQLGFTNPLLVFFFTLQGKVVFLLLAFLIVSACKKVLSPLYQFLFGWFALAFIASLLSNRPYPHYFLQAIPPLALIIAVGKANAWAAIKQRDFSATKVITIVLSAICFALFVWVILIMKVGFYPTVPYYQSFTAYATGSISRMEYYQRFNYLMNENYEVTPLIRSENPDKMFIWGTNPMLYALSSTRPVGKFTVAFHIEDLHVQDETIDEIRKEMPLYIVVMKDQPTLLPGLNTLLEISYMPVKVTDHMIVWRKLANKRV
jgi:hypothetical protein